MSEGPSFRSIRLVMAAVNADLALGTSGIVMLLGAHNLNQNDDPGRLGGVVVVVPKRSPVAPPPTLGEQDFAGGQIPLSVQQLLEITFWARADTQTDPNTQYDFDLEVCEQFRAIVVDSFTKYIPGSETGGYQDFPKRGENEWGAKIVLTMTVQIDMHTTPHLAAPDDTTANLSAEISPSGESI